MSESGSTECDVPIEMKCMLCSTALFGRLKNMMPGEDVQNAGGNFFNSLYNTIRRNTEGVPSTQGNNNELWFLLPIPYTGDTEKDILFMNGIIFNILREFIRALMPTNITNKESFNFPINNDEDLSFYKNLIENLLMDSFILLELVEKLLMDYKEELDKYHEKGDTFVVPFPPHFMDENFENDKMVHFNTGSNGWSRGADFRNGPPKMCAHSFNIPTMQTRSTTQMCLFPNENVNLIAFRENVSHGTRRSAIYGIYSEYWGLDVDEFYRKHIGNKDEEESLETYLRLLMEKCNIPK